MQIDEREKAGERDESWLRVSTHMILLLRGRVVQVRLTCCGNPTRTHSRRNQRRVAGDRVGRQGGAGGDERGNCRSRVERQFCPSVRVASATSASVQMELLLRQQLLLPASRHLIPFPRCPCLAPSAHEAEYSLPTRST